MKNRLVRPSGLEAVSQGWRWLGQLGEGRPLDPPPEGLAETLRRHCHSLPERQITRRPVGHLCPLPAALWHAEQLCDTLNQASLQDQGKQARLAYHARWILRLSEPDDPRWRALVSVIIPVFNRDELVCDAIDSALAQTHPAVEVIVVVVGINGLTTLRRRLVRSLTAKPISDLELSHYHLRCLISLLQTPGHGGRFGPRLIRRHLCATSLPALVANRGDVSDRLRTSLSTALEAMAEEARTGSPRAAALLGSWRRQLKAVLTLCPEITSDPWVQALERLSGAPADESHEE